MADKKYVVATNDGLYLGKDRRGKRRVWWSDIGRADRFDYTEATCELERSEMDMLTIMRAPSASAFR